MINKMNYREGLKKIIDKFVIERFHYESNILSSNILSIFIENIYALVRGKKVRFAYDQKLKLFLAKEKGLVKYNSEKFRCFWLYRDGIKTRGKFIFNSYRLHNINFNKNDVIVDCGANSGDLFIELEKFIKPKNYIAIEPNPADYKSLKFNCKGSHLIKKGLGDKNTIKQFFTSTNFADSSIIEPKCFEKIIKVKLIKFDDLINELNIKRIKLLKIEAEGYEPEVLLGAKEKISICEYIAIDGGYERGVNEEQTLTQITNYLINRNFELCDIFFPWYRALFKNKKP